MCIGTHCTMILYVRYDMHWCTTLSTLIYYSPCSVQWYLIVIHNISTILYTLCSMLYALIYHAPCCIHWYPLQNVAIDYSLYTTLYSIPRCAMHYAKYPMHWYTDTMHKSLCFLHGYPMDNRLYTVAQCIILYTLLTYVL